MTQLVVVVHRDEPLVKMIEIAGPNFVKSDIFLHDGSYIVWEVNSKARSRSARRGWLGGGETNESRRTSFSV